MLRWLRHYLDYTYLIFYALDENGFIVFISIDFWEDILYPELYSLPLARLPVMFSLSLKTKNIFFSYRFFTSIYWRWENGEKWLLILFEHQYRL